MAYKNEGQDLPLNSTRSIAAQAVVTLWRFIHDALDAPLSASLGVGWVEGTQRVPWYLLRRY